MSAKLAAQVPASTPATRHGYHALTLGWYEGELIRLTDRSGRSLGQFFADEVAKPLGLDFYIGLPDSVDRNRVAHFHVPSLYQSLLQLHVLPLRLAVASFNPLGLTTRSLTLAEGIRLPSNALNQEEIREIEMPSGNGTGDAPSIAKLYGSAATGGSELGLSPATFDALRKPAVPPTEGLRDRVLHVDTKYSLGFSKPSPMVIFGSSDMAFGTPAQAAHSDWLTQTLPLDMRM